MINILAWVVAGGVAGWLASRVGGGAYLGLVGDIIIGVLGAAIGGTLLAVMLPALFGIGGTNPTTWLAGLLSAATLLFLVRSMGLSTRSPTRR